MPERAILLVARLYVAGLGLVHVRMVINLVLGVRGPAGVLVGTCAEIGKAVVLVHIAAGNGGIGVPARTPAFFQCAVVPNAVFLRAVAVLALFCLEGLDYEAQGGVFALGLRGPRPQVAFRVREAAVEAQFRALALACRGEFAVCDFVE